MRFVDSLARLVDRYAVVDLEKNRYEYHELVSDTLLYPETGAYQDLIDRFSKRYVVLTNTENAKGGRLISPDYLRKVLRKESDIL